MKGTKSVIDALNAVLTAELTAVNQYFIHAMMCENWGYLRLHAHHRAESIGEMRDAEALIKRILFLDGLPNLQRLNKVGVGETVPEQMKLDQQLEIDAIERLQKAIALSVDEGDFGTRELLEGILTGEESHLDWLESQLNLIATTGIENYLAHHMHPDG